MDLIEQALEEDNKTERTAEGVVDGQEITLQKREVQQYNQTTWLVRVFGRQRSQKTGLSPDEAEELFQELKEEYGLEEVNQNI